MKKIVVLLLILGILFAPLSVDSYEVSPSTLIPGQTGSITITLKNIQPSGVSTITSAVEDVTLYYATAPGVQFLVASPIVVGTIEGGSTALAVIPIKVTDDATGGVVSPLFSIQQRDGTKQSLIVPIKVVNEPILTISLDTQTFTGTNTFNMTITNNGGAAKKLTIKINNSNEFALVGQDQLFIDAVTHTEKTQIRIDSRNAPAGVATLVLSISYQDESGDTKTELKTIAVTVKKEKADVVFTQIAPLTTSKDNTLELKIKNTGRTLSDFRIILNDDKIKAKESNEIKLGDLKQGDERNIKVIVATDANPGVRDTKLVLKWWENDIEKEEETTIPLVISSDADVAIFLEAKPAPIVVNGDHTLSVLVSNIGSYKINNVEVALENGEVLEILNAQKAQYIGGLESDDFSTVQYKVRVKEQQPGFYPVTVVVKYKDQSGVLVEKNISSTLNIRPASDADKKTEGSPVPLVIGIVIIAGVAYWWYKKRKTKVRA